MTFTSPDVKKTVSDEMKTNNSANNIRDRIKKYFNSVGLNTIVTKKIFDAEGAETEDSSLAVKAVFEIRLDRLVSAASFSAAVVNKGSTKAEIVFEPNVVVSNPPMTGQW
jgi:hypothetical protein